MTTSHLRLLTSHRLEVLADALARRLEDPPLGPLQRETIVVPSRGMARWVNVHLARAHGIAASVDFPFPFTWARRTVEALGLSPAPDPASEPPVPEAFDAAALHWRLHEWLGRLDQLDAPAVHLEPLRAYLADDVGLRRRGQLAARLATTFAGYQLQRPQQLVAWEAERWFSQSPDLDAGEAWQAALWRAVVREAPQRSLARALIEAVDGLRSGRLDAWAVGPRVEVFGVTTLPPVLLALLDALGRALPVHVSFVSPTRGYWGDLRERPVTVSFPGLSAADLEPGPDDADAEHAIRGHPLLASWGRLARDFHHAVVSLDESGGLEELDAPPPACTLLGALQADVLDFVDVTQRGASDRPRVEGDDRSLRVHLCHSELREMEVLREAILQAFEDLPDLRPSEVLVLVPELERYAPLARAVLGRALDTEHGERRLPVRIADGGGLQTQAYGRLLLELLRLPDARLTATEVLALFEIDVFARRFGIEAEDLPDLDELVRVAGVRWGEDPQERALRLDLPVYTGASWTEGLDRLVLGFATGAGDELVDGLLPVADATTSRIALVARLARAFDALARAVRDLRAPRPLGTWTGDLRRWLFELSVADSEREAEQRNALASELESLEAIGTHFGLAAEVGRRTVGDALRAVLDDDAAGRGFVSGSITVAELRPMRSLPYRVIAVAGLGDGFPRRDPPPGFDLVARRPARGDRSPRLDDRQLFLEILLAVRDRLVLSAVGRSVRDNTELARSVCLDELLEVLDQSFVMHDGSLPSRAVVVRHPLQPFDRSYVDGTTPELFTYDRGLAEGAAALISARARIVAEGQDTAPRLIDRALPSPGDLARPILQLADLARFFVDPSGWFVQQRMRLRLRREVEELDTEPFAITELSAWRLRDHEWQRAARGWPPEQADAVVQRLGLVQGSFGRALAAVQMQGVRLALQAQGAEPETWSDVEIDVPLRVGDTEVAVVGSLLVHPEHGRIAVNVGALDARFRASTWVEHLALGAATPDGAPWSTHLLSLKDAKSETWSGAPAGRTAQECLAELVRGYLAAHEAPLPFYPLTSAEWWVQWVAAKLPLDPSGTDPARRLEVFRHERVRAEWDQPSHSKRAPESMREAVKLCTRGLSGEEIASAEFAQWAATIFGGIDAVRAKGTTSRSRGAGSGEGPA